MPDKKYYQPALVHESTNEIVGFVNNTIIANNLRKGFFDINVRFFYLEDKWSRPYFRGNFILENLILACNPNAYKQTFKVEYGKKSNSKIYKIKQKFILRHDLYIALYKLLELNLDRHQYFPVSIYTELGNLLKSGVNSEEWKEFANITGIPVEEAYIYFSLKNQSDSYYKLKLYALFSKYVNLINKSNKDDVDKILLMMNSDFKDFT